MRYSAEKRRDNGGCNFETIDTTERYATRSEARRAAAEKWGTDDPVIRNSPAFHGGRTIVEVYDWERRCYVG